MKAIGALPTERRVQEMNNYQWLWFYHNLMEDKKKENQNKDGIIEYLTYFINPDLAKAVQEQKDKKKNGNKRNEIKSTETINDDFEREFGKFFNNKDEFIEIPNSGGLQTNETEEEFFERAMKIQDFIQNNPNDTYFKELPKAQRPKQKKQQHKMTEEEIIKYSIDNDTDMIFIPDQI